MGEYFPECQSAEDVQDVLDNCLKHKNCSHFCAGFKNSVPHVYLSFSVLSALCCFGVLGTYSLIPRLRRGGYSSRVFVYRTVIDLLIAISHIASAGAHLTHIQDNHRKNGCIALGVFNEFALIASNLWYLILAVDLLKALRNPFRATPTYGSLAHTIVWGFSTACAGILILALLGNKGAGLSMFYWCWISVDTDLSQFVAFSFFLYYLPHFVIWVFSTAVLVFVISIFWGGRLSASSETRTFVMKQNGIYVLVLGIETGIILPLWIAQLSILGHGKNSGPVLYFYTKTSFALAVTLAVVHSLRGAIDLFVWCLTFSIGPADFKLMYNRMRQKFARGPTPAVRDIDVPLLTADTVVNKALRRDTMYCINVGILDAVMLDTDLENRQLETEERYSNPFYREQSERKITFPSSASIQSFAFVDIEPAIFHLLRAAYGISSADYRQSFKLQNAADVESSRMLEKFTEGKSGSFFYFSHDFHYIIKTVTAEEEKFLRRVAYYYYKHMKQNPSSLIVRFYGLHKVRLAPEQRYITVVVMENIFSKFDQLRIDHTYDLKGSTLGRRSLKRGQTRESYRGTMKDLDLDHPIVIGPDNKARLMKQLRRDVAFLTHYGIMDYSLLIGIHKITSGDDGQCDPEPNTPWFRQDKGGLRSYSPFHPCSIYEQQKSGRDTFRGMTEYQGTNVNDLPIATYFFGIVDVLQEYNLRKKAEHILKTRFLCRNRHKVSVVNQQEYGERFLKAMDKIFQ